jgi:hypothetical protein
LLVVEVAGVHKALQEAAALAVLELLLVHQEEAGRLKVH